MATTQVTHIDTIEEWFAKYKPVSNPYLTNADTGWDGKLFETYGEDVAFVRAMPAGHVWTWVDGDDGHDYIVSGFHFVNRIGYFVCAVPEDGMVEVKAWDDDDISFIECSVCGDLSDDTTFVDFFTSPDGEGFCEKCLPQDSLLEEDDK